ncbi:hypothetical protein [Asanoa sp. NPDC050611]|uniref:hypothetical protein n=1 Tax=Asanoa sp. NPDC050611 TaxID=3157098 RepID=UPI00340E162E
MNGGLSPRTRRRVALTAVFLALATVAGWAAAYSGAIVPRVSADQHGWGGSLWTGPLRFAPKPPAVKKIDTSLTLANGGWSTVDIRGIDVDIPGLRFEGASHTGVRRSPEGVVSIGSEPLTAPLPLAPDQQNFALTLSFEVTDCAKVPSSVAPIGVRVARPWGEQTIWVTNPPLRPSNGGFAVTSTDDPHRIEWQRFLADDVCGTRWEVEDDDPDARFSRWW